MQGQGADGAGTSCPCSEDVVPWICSWMFPAGTTALRIADARYAKISKKANDFAKSPMPDWQSNQTKSRYVYL